MTLQELQDQLKPWQAHNFPGRPSWQPLVGVQEELGELSHAFLKLQQGIRVIEDHKAKMADAAADIIVYLADFCNAEGINLQVALDLAWREVSQRDWKRFPGNGVNH